MSSLKDVEKLYFEKLLAMGDGYVLNYSDLTFQQFFTSHQVDIHSTKYQKYGTSKAKKLRAFWELEPDALVAKVLGEMLDVYQANCQIHGRSMEQAAYDQARTIVARLSGLPASTHTTEDTENDFLRAKFVMPKGSKLPVEASLLPIIEQRLKEAVAAFNAKAYLATIFLSGSALEAVLLGAAQRAPAQFNQAKSSPKARHVDKVKPLHDWSLAELIDTACEVGLLKPDIKKFSHGLRDFRNYIHPYEQMLSGFTPDEHTASLCLQTLKAALASVAGER